MGRWLAGFPSKKLGNWEDALWLEVTNGKLKLVTE